MSYFYLELRNRDNEIYLENFIFDSNYNDFDEDSAEKNSSSMETAGFSKITMQSIDEKFQNIHLTSRKLEKLKESKKNVCSILKEKKTQPIKFKTKCALKITALTIAAIAFVALTVIAIVFGLLIGIETLVIGGAPVAMGAVLLVLMTTYLVVCIFKQFKELTISCEKLDEKINKKITKIKKLKSEIQNRIEDLTKVQKIWNTIQNNPGFQNISDIRKKEMVRLKIDRWNASLKQLK